MVLSLCREFRVLPSQVLAEDVDLLRMLKIEDLGVPDAERPGNGGPVGGWDESEGMG